MLWYSKLSATHATTLISATPAATTSLVITSVMTNIDLVVSGSVESLQDELEGPQNPPGGPIAPGAPYPPGRGRAVVSFRSCRCFPCRPLRREPEGSISAPATLVNAMSNLYQVVFSNLLDDILDGVVLRDLSSRAHHALGRHSPEYQRFVLSVFNDAVIQSMSSTKPVVFPNRGAPTGRVNLLPPGVQDTCQR
ncbi:hypothetical protein JG687_00004970 [Phytophthora cactorum]|uniref:Uncharacterized protein n=1 Tax=Phytophthora cactorum TaxID=29920 RepID=A0A8T1UMC2_9STRA|nr:hypothetical protein PC120_g10221 [Phytophthora cactorum]KAG3063775.1 hypothetical protein PC121_g12029 [Phytophthora cactorum]KAG4054478.1 hypothetical protein PC123_g10390 [Phytophthora cactorum]KAG6966250.1 hypothetical protein JG687_00004970 [Phytophthora cactorum]